MNTKRPAYSWSTDYPEYNERISRMAEWIACIMETNCECLTLELV